MQCTCAYFAEENMRPHPTQARDAHTHMHMHTQVVKRGYMRKEDGMMMKKWITVYVELREECVCCFNNETERVSV